jgi:hypothetical protein
MRKYFYNAEHGLSNVPVAHLSQARLSGSTDPTAYQALLNILREERRINRRMRRCRKPGDGYYPFKEVFERENYIPF